MTQKLHSAELINLGLNDCVIKLYYYFLSWILPKFTEFNKHFQTQKVVITELHEKIRILYQDILLCFLKRDYVMKTNLCDVDPKNGQYHLVDSQLYLRVQVTKYANTPEVLKKKEQRQYFFTQCRNFLQTAAIEIKKNPANLIPSPP